MERPTLKESAERWLDLSINTRESTYSFYSLEQDKFIDQGESDRKELIEGIKNAINALPCKNALKNLYPDSEENKALIEAINHLNNLIN